jgi:glycosyltransferase involved in cell wall biosynthesis
LSSGAFAATAFNILIMKVSVALASYNGARFIDEQLASLAAQTRLPDELVVCDDGSTDDTLAHVERFAAGAPFEVRIVRNPDNLGFSGNFQRALSLVTGDVVFICDQDDIWYPEKIATSLAALESDPAAALVVNDEHLMDGEGNRLNATFLGNVRKLGYPDTYHCAGCCTVIRRELLDLLLPLGAPINYDLWISNLADFLGLKRVIDVPLQLYRRHGDNSTETVLAEERASLWRLFRAYGLSDPRREWRIQLDALAGYRRRIEERRTLAERLAGPDGVERALARIAAERDRIERRLALLAKPRAARFPSVLKLWSGGFYRDFAGGKSALKDILRA